MATGGAAHLAHACGIPSAALPLLWLAVAQGVCITAFNLYRHRRGMTRSMLTWLTAGSPRQHAGRLTIPLGLAVISVGLARNFGACTVSPITAAGLVLTGLATLVGVGRFIGALHGMKPRLETIDGQWFLVPAALLGAAVATIAALPPAAIPLHDPLAETAIIAAIAGLAGYWLILAGAGLRVLYHGLRNSPGAPWWIAMGCAGLAAAATSSVLQSGADAGLPVTLHDPLETATIATLLMSLVLAIPVVLLSLDFLFRRCHFANRTHWPPTFSTAVLAMGALGVGTLLGCNASTTLGIIAGWATLALWLTSSAWDVGFASRLVWRFVTARRS